MKLKLPNQASTPFERAEAAAKIVKRVELHTNTTPQFQYRDLDGVLQVKSAPDFVREFLRQPEIAEAKPVPSVSSALIEPVKKRGVESSEISKPYSTPRRTTPRGR